MIEPSRAEYLAARLIDVYMSPDFDMHPAYVLAVMAESGLSPEQFDLANVTAAAAARYWWATNPDLGRRLVKQRLTEMTGIPA